MTTAAEGAREPELALPAGRLAATACAAAAGGAAVWAAAAGEPVEVGPRLVVAGAGAALVAAVSIMSLLAIAPGRPRAVSAWVTAWLAASLIRLLLTPLGGYLLYSATPLALAPLLLAVAAAYLAAQLAEAAVLAVHVKRIT